MTYNIADSETEEKKTLSFIEDATTDVVNHSEEHAIAKRLTNSLTEIQDEHDDIMDGFRQILREKRTSTITQRQKIQAPTSQPAAHIVSLYSKNCSLTTDFAGEL